MRLTRRHALAAAFALAPGRGRAAPGFGAVPDRARALPQLWSLSVARHGETVYAEAFRGPGLDRPVNVKSVSKSFVAALAGAAIDRGQIPGPRATLGELAPRLIPRGTDPRVAEITVGHLLTLRAGLERPSGPAYGEWVSWHNWVADALGRPKVAEPGTLCLYSTGSTHVLGAVLSAVTGESLPTLARELIGAPLGIEIPAWTRDPQGRYLGGNEMTLTPAALVAFGEAYRRERGGMVSPGWVRESWTPRAFSSFSGDHYGYDWFLRRAGGHEIAYARGYGGQMLWVVPTLGLTVVAISDPNLPARSDGHVGKLQRLLAEAVLPAAEAG